MAQALKDRTAFVTGASRGIGKAIATRFAAEGASVAICSRPTPGLAELGTLAQAAEELRGFGNPVYAFHADLSDPADGRRDLIAQVEAELGPVDILINNAAAGGYRGFLDWTDEQIEQLLQVNFWAPWELTRAVLPGMQERGRGWIVNLSSASALQPPGPPFPQSLTAWAGSMYGGTKAFLDRWTTSLAAEMIAHGIAVNTLAPQAAAATEVLVEHANIPEHLYEPLETMAEAALALATADPNQLTGQVTYSLALLHQLDRATFDLAGETQLSDWDPDTLPPRIDKMIASRIATGDRNAAGGNSANPYGLPGNKDL